jgi:cysteine desulfurase/selenocysteine lyase
MIKDVSLRKLLMLDCLHKFEAGTPNVAGGIVLDAVDYMNEVGFENIQKTRT